MRPGVYVHIPFCEQRCYYCAFTVAVSPEHTYEPYVRRLIREIDLSEFKEEPETIFFGGGTPSIIDAALIERIIHALPGGAAEITIEANPGTITDSKLECYRDIGVNRVSVGVQSFYDEDLKNAGRLHSAADVLRDIESLRKHRFENINVDLIAGLVNQRLEVWKQNLGWIERLRPEHTMIEQAGRARLHQRDVVHDARRVGKHLTHPGAVLPVPTERPASPQQLRPVAAAHERKAFPLDEGLRDGLAVQFDQARLVIEQLQL